jgi:hypothetical protein
MDDSTIQIYNVRIDEVLAPANMIKIVLWYNKQSSLK